MTIPDPLCRTSRTRARHISMLSNGFRLLSQPRGGNEIETRNVDAIKNPPPQDVDALSNNSDLVVQEFQELSNFFVSLNIGSTQFGFDDLRVRQAISHAIDRESIVASILRGRAVATYGPFLPGYKWYNPEVENFNQFDVDRARALLDEAGWVASGSGIREKDGARLSFPMLHLSEATENAVMEAHRGDAQSDRRRHAEHR